MSKPRFKRVHLNGCEARTFSILEDVTREYDAKVFSKLSLRDVLSFEDAGLNGELRRFCWDAHFDFVVTDSDTVPLFAVEFDGPTHASERQSVRGGKKDRICELFQLPLLRINSKYLSREFRETTLLRWFTECFFLQRIFREAEEKGTIDPEDGFDPMCVAAIGSRTASPLDFAHDARLNFRLLHKAGVIFDEQPSYFVARCNDGAFRASAFIALSATDGVFVKTGMRAKNFEIDECTALEMLIHCELLDLLSDALNGRRRPRKLDHILERMANFVGEHEYGMLGSRHSRWTDMLTNMGLLGFCLPRIVNARGLKSALGPSEWSGLRR